jgi:hypothetical protein
MNLGRSNFEFSGVCISSVRFKGNVAPFKIWQLLLCTVRYTSSRPRPSGLLYFVHDF